MDKELLAALLTLKGETDPARIRAYQERARTEFAAAGRSTTLDELREQVPPGLADMLRVPGLGAAKVRLIHEELDIDSIAELETAAGDGRLAGLRGFGPKTAENIRRGIAALREGTEYRLLHHAIDEAEAIARNLAALPGVRRVEIAGDVRRRCELIRDLAFLVVQDEPHQLRTPPGVHLFPTTPQNAGLALLRATGSDAHVAQLEERAQGRGLALAAGSWPDEESVYRALGLPWIAPELREGMGEVQAAADGRLPRLLVQSDLKGLLHCHTNYSDGTTTVAEWAEACRAAGYAWMGITDHGESSAYVSGLRAEHVERQHVEIDVANRRFDDVRILKGVEADILADGSLDYGPAVLDRFDFVIASIHTRFGMTADEMTARVLKALDDPHTTILGHPTGRLLLSREPYAIDMDRVMERAAERGVAIELNADPHRLDLDWRLVRRARDLGVTISLGADAHSVAGMSNVAVGVGIARKGWLAPDDVINTRDADGFLAFARAYA